MARSKKMPTKAKMSRISEDDLYKTAVTKLVCGVVRGAKLDAQDCVQITKHIMQLEKVADQMRVLALNGII